MPTLYVGNDVFDADHDLIEVTSLHRPDPRWRFIDAHGHEHRWHANGNPAVSYNPSVKYTVPSIVSVLDSWRYDEDGERFAVSHHECLLCTDRVEPGYTFDTTTQHIGGLRWYRINGKSVSPDEFTRRLNNANA